jgi:hypothetical protein
MVPEREQGVWTRQRDPGKRCIPWVAICTMGRTSPPGCCSRTGRALSWRGPIPTVTFPMLEQIRGPHPIAVGITAYKKHVRRHPLVGESTAIPRHAAQAWLVRKQAGR